MKKQKAEDVTRSIMKNLKKMNLCQKQEEWDVLEKAILERTVEEISTKRV